MIYYLSCWYGPARMARAIALVFVAGPLGGIVGGPVSAWLMTSLSGVGGLAGWQWMFLVEGLPCIALGLLTLRVLSDRPEQARWLNDDEKLLLGRETAPTEHRADSFKAVLKSPRVYVLALAYFSIIFPIYAISFWLPTLLKDQGVSDTIRLGWYTAIPYVAAAVCMYLAGRSSDRVGERRFHCAIPALGAALCLVAAVFADGSVMLTLVALTLGTACLWMAYTVFWAIPSQLVEGTAAAGGIALINTVGLSGGFWGPAVVGWAKASTGSVHTGLFVMAGAAALAAILILTGKLTLKQD
jgi:MFS family permease